MAAAQRRDRFSYVPMGLTEIAGLDIIFIFIHIEKVEKRKKENLTVQITQIISYLNHATVPVNLSCRFFNNTLGNL